MPPAGAQKPSIEYRHNVAKGQHEIGVKVEKVFVAFATVSDAYFAQLYENAQNIAGAEGEAEGEPE